MRLITQFPTGEIEYDNEGEMEAVKRFYDVLSRDPRIDQERSFIVPKFKLIKSTGYDLETILFIKLLKKIWGSFEIDNLLFAVEIKSHRRDGVDIFRNDVKVRYGDKRKSAIRQVKRNAIQLGEHLDQKIKETFGGFCKWVFELVFFVHITFGPERSSSSEDVWAYILGGDEVSLDNFINLAIEQWVMAVKQGKIREKFRDKPSSVFLRQMNFDNFNRLFRDEYIKPSSYDRKRLDQLTHNKINVMEHLGILEDENCDFLVVKGGAGTGKTIALLELAKQFSESGERVLLTTYNIVLATDLRRIMHLYYNYVARGLFLDAEKNITVSNIDLLISDWAEKAADFIGKEDILLQITDEEYEVKYAERKRLIKQLIQEFYPDDMDEVRELLDIPYDYVLIDEAQDWDNEAFEILRKLVKPSCKFVIVYSEDQRLKHRRLNIIDYSEKSRTKKHRTDYRHFSGIDRFARYIVKQVRSDKEYVVADLGEVDIIPDKNLSIDFIKMLLKELKKDNADPSDLLVIEPDIKAIQSAGGIDLVEELENNGILVWNAHKYTTKREIRFMNKPVRVVDYESSRGLESWIVLMRLADVAYDRSYKRFSEELRKNMIYDSEEKIDRASRERSRRLLYIAASRAVKKLIVTFHDKNHHIIRELFEIKRRIFPDEYPEVKRRESFPSGRKTKKKQKPSATPLPFKDDDLPF